VVEALILAKLRQDAVRCGDGQPQRQQRGLDAPLGLRVGKAEEQGDGNGLSAAGPHLFNQHGKLFPGRRPKDLALSRHPLRHAKTKRARHQAHWRRRKPAVEPFAGLAANRDGVFKPLGGDEGHARAGPLQHGVGSHGSSVAHVKRLARANLPQPLQYRQRGVRGRGKQLEHAQTAIRKVHTVRKSSAGIDRCAQNGLLSYP